MVCNFFRLITVLLFFNFNANAQCSIDSSLFNYNFTSSKINIDYLIFKPGSVVDISCNNQKVFMPHHGSKTSSFGERWGRLHCGIDLNVYVGQPIYSMLDGVVRYVGYQHNGYGNVIVIRHYNGIETLYAHLSQINVKKGYIINAGDIIGLGGNTGRSTGPHLHFELRINGMPINPELIINFIEMKLNGSSILIGDNNNIEIISKSAPTRKRLKF